MWAGASWASKHDQRRYAGMRGFDGERVRKFEEQTGKRLHGKERGVCMAALLTCLTVCPPEPHFGRYLALIPASEPSLGPGDSPP